MKVTEKTACSLCVRLLCGALTLCMLLVGLCGCAHKISSQENGAYYKDEETGISYRYAGVDWLPVKRGSLFANIVRGEVSVPLYAINGMETDAWLCSADGDVFYAADAMLTLEQFQADTAQLCQQTTKDTILQTISDAAIVRAITDMYLGGVAIDMPDLTDCERYELYLTSTAYVGLKYHLIVYIFPTAITYVDGNGDTCTTTLLLYSRANKRAVDGSMFFEEYAQESAA